MTFTTIFSVTPDDIGRLSVKDSVRFIAGLLYAEAARIGVSRTNINVSTRTDVADGGVDADVQGAPAGGELIKDGRTAYQIKSGKTFAPWTESAIKEELFGKKNVERASLGDSTRACLDADGTYVMVCTGIDFAGNQRADAIAHVRKLLQQCQYADPKVDALSQNHLLALASRVPSLCLQINGKGGARFQTLPVWKMQDQMRTTLKVGKPQEDTLSAIRDQIRKNDTAIHVHLQGEAGVGKTRLCLEAVNADDLGPRVIYCDSPSKVADSDLLNEIIKADNDFEVILVVDECGPKARADLWNTLKARGPRIKLISIYNEFEKLGGNTVIVEAPPLDNAQIAEILKDYIPATERADQWADYCSGSPRVAHVIGANLRDYPDDLLRSPDTVNIWERYIAGGDDPASYEVKQRQLVLRYLALFKRVGHGPPVADESEAVGKLIKGADPAITQPRFHEIIAQLRGRKILQGETTLYITPKLLHIKLWTEWFDNYALGFAPDKFEAGLPEQLVEWFREMYEYAKESKAAMKKVKELLDETGPFGDGSFFQDRRGAEFFLRLTDAAPELALRRLERTIATWTLDELRTFKEGRRQVVWALERIAVWRPLFPGAARLLLRLAEAETETGISNNATGVFADLFSAGHGPVAPTEAPPEERFPVLVEALTSSSSDQRKLGLAAAAHALETGRFSRMVGAEYQGLRRPPELWTPKTWGEIFDAYRRPWRLLVERLDDMPDDERQEAIKVLLRHARGLGAMANLTEMVVETLLGLLQKPYVDRTQLIDTVENIYRYDGESFSPETRPLWDRLRSALEPTTLHSRLERYVAMNRLEDSLNRKGKQIDTVGPVLKDLAVEAYRTPGALEAELQWLVTDRAKNGFRFGYELGVVDTEAKVLPRLLAAQAGAGTNASAFFLGGYLRALGERNRESLEVVMDALANHNDLFKFVPELTWRTEVSARGAERMLHLVKAGKVDSTTLRLFVFGGSVRDVPEAMVHSWIDTLIDANTFEAAATAVDLYHSYYLMGGRQEPLPKELTLRLLLAPPFFAESESRDRSASQEYDWNEIAEAFIKHYPDESVQIGGALLEHFGEEGTVTAGFNPHAVKALDEIMRLHGERLWPAIKEYLGPPIDTRAFRIKHWLHDGALWSIPVDQIWEWVDADPDKRAWYVASFVPKAFPGKPEACSAREILVRYGSRPEVRNSLSANFSSEGWSGPASGHYEQKLEWVRLLRENETNSNVLRWLDEYRESVENQLQQARVHEERHQF